MVVTPRTLLLENKQQTDGWMDGWMDFCFCFLKECEFPDFFSRAADDAREVLRKCDIAGVVSRAPIDALEVLRKWEIIRFSSRSPNDAHEVHRKWERHLRCFLLGPRTRARSTNDAREVRTRGAEGDGVDAKGGAAQAPRGAKG